MEIMDNNIDRTIDRCWQIINEVDNFIVKNDTKRVFYETRQKYRWNYFLHLERLYKARQLFIQRNEVGQIIGICGWILINKEDEHKINKTTWSLPEEISNGENLCITICVINGGNMNELRREFRKRLTDKVDEIFWFDIPHNKFVRKKNILKENLCKIAV